MAFMDVFHSSFVNTVTYLLEHPFCSSRFRLLPKDSPLPACEAILVDIFSLLSTFTSFKEICYSFSKNMEPK